MLIHYCELPPGWDKAFYKDLISALETAYREDGINPDGVFIGQIKEKFGQLRVYPDVETTKTTKVIERFNEMAQTTCSYCGEQTFLRDRHTNTPLCIKCQALLRR